MGQVAPGAGWLWPTSLAQMVTHGRWEALVSEEPQHLQRDKERAPHSLLRPVAGSALKAVEGSGQGSAGCPRRLHGVTRTPFLQRLRLLSTWPLSSVRAWPSVPNLVPVWSRLGCLVWYLSVHSSSRPAGPARWPLSLGLCRVLVSRCSADSSYGRSSRNSCIWWPDLFF